MMRERDETHINLHLRKKSSESEKPPTTTTKNINNNNKKMLCATFYQCVCDEPYSCVGFLVVLLFFELYFLGFFSLSPRSFFFGGSDERL